MHGQHRVEHLDRSLAISAVEIDRPDRFVDELVERIQARSLRDLFQGFIAAAQSQEHRWSRLPCGAVLRPACKRLFSDGNRPWRA